MVSYKNNWYVPFWNIPIHMARLQGSRKQAVDKALAEYDMFNKQQRIDSDFDRQLHKHLKRLSENVSEK